MHTLRHSDYRDQALEPHYDLKRQIRVSVNCGRPTHPSPPFAYIIPRRYFHKTASPLQSSSLYFSHIPLYCLPFAFTRFNPENYPLSINSHQHLKPLHPRSLRHKKPQLFLTPNTHISKVRIDRLYFIDTPCPINVLDCHHAFVSGPSLLRCQHQHPLG